MALKFGTICQPCCEPRGDPLNFRFVTGIGSRYRKPDPYGTSWNDCVVDNPPNMLLTVYESGTNNMVFSDYIFGVSDVTFYQTAWSLNFSTPHDVSAIEYEIAGLGVVQ